jgi:hypothetical protein
MELGVEPARAGGLRSQHLCQPSRYHHEKRVATKCGHRLHLSASPHTPYCRGCVHAAAKSKMDTAFDCLRRNCGPQRSWNTMDINWKRANLSHKAAIRHLEQVRKKGQLQAAREQAWDEAHSKAQVSCVDQAGRSGSDLDCPVCVLMMGRPEGHQRVVDKHIAWWEHLGVLALDAAPQTPLRSRGQKRVNTQVQHKGSPTMRSIIQKHRAAHASEIAEQEQLEQRYKTETAVRRKHQLSQDTQFHADFWDSPISGLITRQHHVLEKEYQRMSERRARGNTPRPRPPRSSLSFCESTGEPGINDDVTGEIKAQEEAQERERWERKARKIGAEVSYLYFSGTVDGLEDWREEYLRSNHSLIWRDRQQREDAMELD